MRGLHLGQAMDINWHRCPSLIPDIDEYFVMCGFKTGGLARLAAELGVYAAGASKDTAKKLSDTAEKLGIGFQILDDVKNLTTGIPGKMRGDDIVEGKKSLPVLLYLTRYPEKREMVYYCFQAAKIDGIAAQEVELLISALTETGVIDEAGQKGHELITRAREIFNSAELKNKVLLDNFIDLII